MKKEYFAKNIIIRNIILVTIITIVLSLLLLWIHSTIYYESISNIHFIIYFITLIVNFSIAFPALSRKTGYEDKLEGHKWLKLMSYDKILPVVIMSIINSCLVVIEM